MAKKKTTTGVILTARQLLNGYTTDVDRRFLWNTMPYQMLPKDEKDDDWRKWNMDWLEYIGMKQVMNSNRKMTKNYHLANGIIDKADYILGEKNDYNDMVETIGEDTGSPFSLKFYPIIPNVINVLVGEFAKRDSKIVVKAVDEFAENEKMQQKMQDLTQILIQDAQQQIELQAQAGGQQVSQQALQQQMQTTQQLIQTEMKYKNYRGVAEQWGQHMIEYDDQRFKMYEKEAWAFRDSLVVDREFWHVQIDEDDYKVELWNPKDVFYHKSPDTYYTSEGNHVGRILLQSIPDVIDGYGRWMDADQLEALKSAQQIAISGGHVVDDARRWDPTQYWDASKPYNEQQPNSIHFEQYVGMKNIKDDIEGLDWNNLAKYDQGLIGHQSLLRVTEAYWRSQRKVGHLTWVKQDGTIVQETVDEDYKVNFKPVYDTSIKQNKGKDNLAYGEHIDWIWINEVWRGIKIGPNNATYYQARGYGFEAIYVKIEPLQFQFKGQDSLYGCKLPVEGRIFSERNSVSSSMVDKMKSNQVGFNITNNRVMDLMADEIGKVLLIDQNMIPRNSLEGSWGRYNLPKFYQVMKDFQVATVDGSLQNTESPGTNFQHFQQVDLTKTEQIMTQMKLAEYFKNECFSVVGITPQRLGEVAASESATGTQQAVNNSYSQTEIYFDQHMNHLMPRVRQMMLDAAQYINATKPESKIAYLNKKEEDVFFKVEGYKLLLADFQIYSMSRANIKETLTQLKQLAAQNNTSGGSLYDLAKVMSSDSVAEILEDLKKAEGDRQDAEQSQQQAQQQQQQQQLEVEQAMQEKQLQHDDYWKERQIEADIYIAEIKAMGYAKDTDTNTDGIPDALEVDKFLHQQGHDEQDINLKERQLSLSQKQHADNMDIAKKKIDAEKYKADMSLKIAKTNAKNKPKSR